MARSAGPGPRERVQWAATPPALGSPMVPRFPAPRASAPPRRPPLSLRSARPAELVWPLREGVSGLPPAAAARRCWGEAGAGVRGGPGSLPSPCPSRGRREAGWRAPVLGSAAQGYSSTLPAPWRRVDTPLVPRGAFPIGPAWIRGSPALQHPAPLAPCHFPALCRFGHSPGSVTGPVRKAGLAAAIRDLCSLCKGSYALSMPSHVLGPVTRGSLCGA